MVIKINYTSSDIYVSTNVSPVYVVVNYSGTSGGGGAVWGDITGTLSDQTDLQNALNAKFDDPTGTTAQYLRGDGSLATFPTIPSGTVTSVGLTMPSAFAVANSPVTSSGTLAVTGAGTADQYVRGDGQLANFPTNGGGGSSVNYYLNGSVTQGTFGGDTYYEMSKTPIIGAGTNFTRTNAEGNGYIASFITDAGDPALLNIPGGNWNLEFYFQASSSGSTPSFYGEIYKVSASNVFTLIASGSTNPEGITNGTAIDQYFTSIPVPQTALLATDRLAIRIFVTPSGRNITLHTENSNLCEVLTTFSTGLNALNGLTSQVQYFATGTSGTDFAISSVTDTHTFNLPTASAANRGALSSADWTTFNNKQNALTNPITGTGTINTLPKFTGASTIGNSAIFENGTNVGINTASPSSYTNLTALTINGTNGSVLDLKVGNTLYGELYALSNELRVDAVGVSSVLKLLTNSVTKATIFSTGNLLLQNGGTFTDAGYRLDVNGTARVSGDATFSANVGIGVTAVPYSGGAKCLNLFSNTTIGEVRITNSTTGNAAAAGLVLTQVGVNSSIVNANNGNLNFATNNTNKATIDASGNLGLGVTPSAWIGAGSAININTVGSVRADGFVIGVNNNTFFNGSNWIYQITRQASKYEQVNGQHQWFNAPSGTAGNAISFTQAMTLTSGGNLLVGTTTDAGQKLQVSGQTRIDSTGTQLVLGTSGIAGAYEFFASTGNELLITRSGVGTRLTIASTGAATFSSSVTANAFYVPNGGDYGWGDGSTYIDGDASNQYIRFIINSSERARINSGGNLLVGTTTDNGSRLQVTGNGYFSGRVGVGTSNPQENLHISATNAGLDIDGTTSSRTYYNRSGAYIWSTGLRAGDTKFYIYDERVGERFTIDDSGNVGIINATPTAALDTPASTTSRATMRIRSGVAPTTPNNGDIWFDGTDLKMRIGGVTKTFTLV